MSTSQFIFCLILCYNLNMDYICNICGRQFPTARGLKIHVKRIHERRDLSRLLVCNRCHHAYSSLNEDGLCGNCSKAINGFKKMCPMCYEKKLFHANAQKFCDDCKIKLEADRLERIVKREQPVTCDICGLVCASTRNLKRHQTVKHSSYGKDESWSKCTHCHKRYKTLKDGLCGYCNLHINGKDAICPQCNRQVKFYSNRQKVCNECRKAGR